jgi:hypothetical protein
MSSVVLTGDTSGAGTITVPAVAGTFTATIGSATGTHYPFTAGTAVASTSGTSIDFTSIPSWVKRITVIFKAVSTNGSSLKQIQLGDSGGIETTSYVSSAAVTGPASAGVSSTTGFVVQGAAGAGVIESGSISIVLVSGTTWVASGVLGREDAAGYVCLMGGTKTLSDTLTQIRITTVNGTDTFDAGSINILYE